MKKTENKTVKKSTKKVTKKTKFVPKYIYDITNCESEMDILFAFGTVNIVYGLDVTADMHEAMMEICKQDMLYLLSMMTDSKILMRDNGLFTEVPNTKVYKLNTDEKAVIKNGNVVVQKKNVFKRFWNWITRKK